MSHFRARPYAKALLQVVLQDDPGALEAIQHELEAVGEAFAQVPELGRVMVTPALPQERKQAILDAVLERLGVHPLVRRFLHVLQRHYRLAFLPQVSAAYAEQVDRKLGRVRARVEVPGPVEESSRRKIVEALSEILGAKVVAEFIHNEELLAGFKARVGSRVYDGSALGQLERLRRAAAGLE